MDTLHLVSPQYRETASVIPIFDYEEQGVEFIRPAILAAYGQKYGPPDVIPKEEVFIPREDGGAVRALFYRPRSRSVRGAILHIHGGGWISGSADMMASLCAEIAERHGVIVLSADYRLTPEVRGEVLSDDCYTAFLWLCQKAEELGVRDHVAVFGDSAGGNLSAGVALRARDNGVPLKAQLLIYPALDDRTGSAVSVYDNPIGGQFVISPEYLAQLWSVYLKDVPMEKRTYLTPARATDLTGLAPAFIAVGSLDIAVDEALDYAGRLIHAGVPTDLHVYDGVFHAFDMLPGRETDRYNSDLVNAIEKMLA